jgi:hypothetical protein
MKTTVCVFAVCLAMALCTSLCLVAAEQPTCLARQLGAKSTRPTQPIDFTALSKPPAPISSAVPRVGFCSFDCTRCVLGSIPDSCLARGLGHCFTECA